ncbi:MAG: RNA polymerase sigma factor, partial [Steroidobacteraceae bacterium]
CGLSGAGEQRSALVASGRLPAGPGLFVHTSLNKMGTGQPESRPLPSPRHGAHEMSDRDLVDEVLRKDRKATAELVARHADDVYDYVKRRLAGRVDLVEDVVQETFLAAWGSLAGFQGEAPLRIWLLGIARHKVADHYRRRLREIVQWADDDSAVAEAVECPDPVEELSRHEVGRRAREVLAELPERYGLILTWRYWQQRTVRQMAIETGGSEKAVEQLLARARTAFKKRWNEQRSRAE